MTRLCFIGRRLLMLLGLAAIVFAFFPDLRPAWAERIPAASFQTDSRENGLPAGWELERRTGRPTIDLVREGDRYYLHLVAENEAAFGLRREFKVDIREYPFLSWRWQALRLPPQGDVRAAATDDQALQLYVAFQPLGFPAKLKTPVIGYIWDSRAPRGWMGRSSQPLAGLLRYVVVRNAQDPTKVWFEEKRNVLEDFRRLFPEINNGVPPGPTVGIQIYINNQRTGDPAEGLIGEVYFHRR
jgi:hypothetical protein